MADPVLLWFRRDLRLADNPALAAACRRGGPVVPVFIRDDSVDRLGAAARFRLGLAIGELAKALRDRGSRLILRRGPAREVLAELVAETGARAVHWSRLYGPEAIERDARIKAALKDDGVEAESFNSHLLFEPWTVETQQGKFYKVYSPMWRAVKDRDVPEPLGAPPKIPAPGRWPDSDALDVWRMAAAMNRGADVVRHWCRPGESVAMQRLDAFIRGIDGYKTGRDMVGQEATSGMSEHLTYGEISPRQCWHAALRSDDRGQDAEIFRKELVWREFGYHLMYHTPRLLDANWKEEWNAFPWNEDERRKEVIAWKQGRTGVPFVDAAMRELFVTGRMHNRARMIAASYLTKHLMCHWRIGSAWFEDCLIDWDPASNSLGWQWAAGSGPDASPFFRVFNPELQAEKFDPDAGYRRRWIVEGADNPTETALSYFDAVPKSWNLSPQDPYPDPIIGMKEGRDAALAAYRELRSEG